MDKKKSKWLCNNLGSEQREGLNLQRQGSFDFDTKNPLKLTKMSKDGPRITQVIYFMKGMKIYGFFNADSYRAVARLVPVKNMISRGGQAMLLTQWDEADRLIAHIEHKLDLTRIR